MSQYRLHNYSSSLVSARFCRIFGIGYARVIDGAQTRYKRLFYFLYIVEREWRVVVQAVGNLTVNQSIHKRRNSLGRAVGQRARSSLNSIGHHQYRCLFCARVRTGISKRCRINLFVGMSIAIGHIEILGLTCSVMFGNEIANYRRQVFFLGPFQSIGNMRDNDACTLLRAQCVMGVYSILVFGKERWIFNLADIMIQRSGAHQQ